nr:MAG TPA: hypothetical protein [Caudoviricetes sp.]
MPLLSTKQGTDLGIALIPLAGFCKGTEVIFSKQMNRGILYREPK